MSRSVMEQSEAWMECSFIKLSFEFTMRVLYAAARVRVPDFFFRGEVPPNPSRSAEHPHSEFKAQLNEGTFHQHS